MLDVLLLHLDVLQPLFALFVLVVACAAELLLFTLTHEHLLFVPLVILFTPFGDLVGFSPCFFYLLKCLLLFHLKHLDPVVQSLHIFFNLQSLLDSLAYCFQIAVLAAVVLLKIVASTLHG